MKIAKVGETGLVKAWVEDFDDIEIQSREQLLNLASLPFIFKHVAAMPDVHWGNGTSVGTVFASKDAIIPSAVGVDIGCGMIALRLTLRADEVRDKAKAIAHEIERGVPTGRFQHREVTMQAASWPGWMEVPELLLNDSKLFHKAMLQIGTLGGGNHFIEISEDQDGMAWIVLHSGSRNVGKTLADIHINKAKGLMKQWLISLPDPQLAYLARHSTEFESYVSDAQWAQMYALANRKAMLDSVVSALERMFPDRLLVLDSPIQCHHNYISLENVFGENVYVTRKGAIRAREGDLGIIPGSMGTKSYIVRGRGNEESFFSASHGAGRKMSRTEARKRFSLDDLKNQTSGIEIRLRESIIDEAPGAYKNIDQVMENQKDLVEIITPLRAILSVKGD